MCSPPRCLCFVRQQDLSQRSTYLSTRQVSCGCAWRINSAAVRSCKESRIALVQLLAWPAPSQTDPIKLWSCPGHVRVGSVAQQAAVVYLSLAWQTYSAVPTCSFRYIRTRVVCSDVWKPITMSHPSTVSIAILIGNRGPFPNESRVENYKKKKKLNGKDHFQAHEVDNRF